MKKYISLGIVIAFISIIYFSWFSQGLISAGDFWFFFPSVYSRFDLYRYAWIWETGNGMGINSVLYQAVLLAFGVPIYILGVLLKLPWELVERFGFFYPFLIIGVISSYFLHKKILGVTKLWFITALVLLTNTYILTLVGGGQIMIGISYVLTPLVIVLFIESINSYKRFSNADGILKILITALLIGVECLLDLRIAYIAILAVFLYFVVYFVFYFKKNDITGMIKRFAATVLLPFVIAGLLNSFWLIQLAINRKNPLNELGDAYSAVGSVKFFSFATLENSISLLHPNWPENLFGKVSFMRPEFLVVPIIAFAALLFIPKISKSSQEKVYILYFSLLALVGAFLAKGAQEPFGNIYLLLFSYAPGMGMFRDPTKFYLLIAVSYSILISYTLYKLSVKRFKAYLLVPFIFVIFWLITIWPAVSQQLGGTFKHTTIPTEYLRLEKMLSSDSDYYRTLWIPSVNRFAYYSQVHPPIIGNDYLKQYSLNKIIKVLDSDQMEKKLQDMSVRYVIIPQDSKGEIFLEDRRYSNNLREKYVSAFKKIDYLKQMPGFSDIDIFEISGSKDHFWTSNPHTSLVIRNVSPVEYLVQITGGKKGDKLVFAENFDAHWQAYDVDNNSQNSKKYGDRLNSFILPRNGDYQLRVYYQMQNAVNMGLVISAISLFTLLVVIIALKKKS